MNVLMSVRKFEIYLSLKSESQTPTWTAIIVMKGKGMHFLIYISIQNNDCGQGKHNILQCLLIFVMQTQLCLESIQSWND